MTERVIDTVGTLELVDTGRRCDVRNVRILYIRCTKRCGGASHGDELHDGIVEPLWRISKELNGYHSGCDPSSIWSRDPIAAELQQNLNRSLLDKRPVGACPACDELTCTGASS